VSEKRGNSQEKVCVGELTRKTESTRDRKKEQTFKESGLGYVQRQRKEERKEPRLDPGAGTHKGHQAFNENGRLRRRENKAQTILRLLKTIAEGYMNAYGPRRLQKEGKNKTATLREPTSWGRKCTRTRNRILPVKRGGLTGKRLGRSGQPG